MEGLLLQGHVFGEEKIELQIAKYLKWQGCQKVSCFRRVPKIQLHLYFAYFIVSLSQTKVLVRLANFWIGRVDHLGTLPF